MLFCNIFYFLFLLFLLHSCFFYHMQYVHRVRIKKNSYCYHLRFFIKVSPIVQVRLEIILTGPYVWPVEQFSPNRGSLDGIELLLIRLDRRSASVSYLLVQLIAQRHSSRSPRRIRRRSAAYLRSLGNVVPLVKLHTDRPDRLSV